MSALVSSLPAPRHVTIEDASDDESTAPAPAETSTAVAAPRKVPPYGQRKSWRPRVAADFGDGGAYPECHVAQYPLDLGRKQTTTSGNTLALQVDEQGRVKYEAIAQQGHRDGVVVQSTFKDLVPLAQRTDIKNKEMERPSEEEVRSTTERTKAALEQLAQNKIKAAQPKRNVPEGQGAVSFVRYTPQQGSGQRIVKMVEVAEDPLEPPRFKGKKVPRGPPSPPPPVMRSPPRKVTAQEQKEWLIPPSVSNWKNNKGYTIPLDKRLAADGRGLQEVLINDRFAQFSEALYIADRHAREEVRQRALMQQRIAQKEKEQKEEHLRMLAQRAREERTGLAPRATTAAAVSSAAGGVAGTSSAGADYPSDSEALSDDDDDGGREEQEFETEADRKAAAEREAIRRERRKERERELRMSNMGTEQRAKVLARAAGRDISEKIALGLAKPTMSKESMLDARLFNQESLPASFGDDDSYNLYDKPLFSGSSAAAAIYRPRGKNIDDDGNEVALEEGISKSMQNDRFGLGVAGARGFQGADTSEIRDGPVAFEKDTADPFGVDAFLASAKAGAKRGLDDGKGEESSRKRQKDDDEL